MLVSECGLSFTSSIPLCFVSSSEGLERGFRHFSKADGHILTCSFCTRATMPLSPSIIKPKMLVGQGCKFSHIPMTVNQELLSNTKHVQEQKGAITLTLFGPPRDIDKTTLQQPHRVGALLVGGPQHDPQCDKRAQPKDRHHCLSQRTLLLFYFSLCVFVQE